MGPRGGSPANHIAIFCPYLVLDYHSMMVYILSVLLAEGHLPVAPQVEQDAVPANPA